MNLRAFVYEEPRLLARADFADYLDPSTTAVLSRLAPWACVSSM